MEPNSIFISHSEGSQDISGKITLTNILNLIPENSTKDQIINWKKSYKTEWRWRFLGLNPERKVVEISFINSDNKRVYFNRYGNWVERNIDPEYDKFVIDQYFYYTN